jgi:hypothetical protein
MTTSKKLRTAQRQLKPRNHPISLDAVDLIFSAELFEEAAYRFLSEAQDLRQSADRILSEYRSQTSSAAPIKSVRR